MSAFLEKIQPFLHNDDSVMQNFLLRVLDRNYSGTEEELLCVLETENLSPHTIHRLKKYPVSNKSIEKMIGMFHKSKNPIIQRSLASIILLNADGEALDTHKDSLLKLKPYIHKQTLQLFIDCHYASAEDVFMVLEKHVAQLEEDPYFNQQHFDVGAKMVRELASKAAIDEERVCSIIKESMQKEWMDYKGIYYVMLAGERRVKQAIPMLAELLTRPYGEEVLVETASAALKKIGGDLVVEQVEKYIYNKEAALFAVSVIGSVDTPYAEEVLLEALLDVKDISVKTAIADELCNQLSAKAIPYVATLVENGYDEGLLELDEALYANCKINGIEHPDMLIWKKRIQQREKEFTNRQMEIENLFNQRPTEKKVSVGRNDPCICGSGKKYKKCCLK
ncbi:MULTISPECIES: SEC-C metal-binding domain-containing protein [Bacillus]|nr:MULTISPECIES: SEC-C metal-binding domain-containing protein [Bacillus]